MFKHIGTTPTKFTFLINVKSVVLPDMLEEFDGTESLCVSLERKNKPASYTGERNVLLNDKDEIVATFNEALSLSATLYRENKSGLWKDKSVRLSVLQRKANTSSMSKDAFKTIGLVQLPLQEIADCKAHEMDLPLSWCIFEKFAYLEVIVTASISDKDNASEVNSVNDNDDMQSINSVKNSLNGIGSQQHRTLEPMDEEEEEREKYYENSNGVSGSRPAGKELEELRRRLFELENNLLTSSEIVEYERIRVKEAMIRATRAEEELELLCSQKSSKLDCSTKDQYEQELGRLRDEIKRLQTLNDVHQSKASKTDASVSSQIKTLQMEVERYRDENRRLLEDIGKKSNVATSSSEENSRMKSLLSKASDEIDRLSEEKSKLEQLLMSKQDENEVLLSELIQAKLAVGETNIALDEAKQMIKKLKGGAVGGRDTVKGFVVDRKTLDTSFDAKLNGNTGNHRPNEVQKAPANAPSTMLVGFHANGSAFKNNQGLKNESSSNTMSAMKRGFGNMATGMQSLGNSFSPANVNTASSVSRSLSSRPNAN